MLDALMKNLIQELDLGNIPLTSGHVSGTYTLPLDDDIKVVISAIPKGIFFHADIAPFPQTRGEVFAAEVMLGNLFGQGTRNAVLGLNAEGTGLTLSRVVDDHIEYKDFKNALEDFINVIDVWRTEALSGQQQVG